MLFFYYVFFIDNAIQAIGGGFLAKMIESPITYTHAWLYNIWLLLLFGIFLNIAQGDKTLIRGIRFYWMIAIVLILIPSVSRYL